MATLNNYLDRYLDPVTEAFSPDVARSVLNLKPDPVVLARVQELGNKSNSGVLTEDEREEYRALADAGTLVALLKSKAQRVLAQHSTDS